MPGDWAAMAQHPFGLVCLLAFAVATVVSGLLGLAGRHSGLGRDRSDGVQKFHCGETSRLGGLAILLGLAAGLAAAQLAAPQSINHAASAKIFTGALGVLLLACLPAFAGGLVEDLTHRVGIAARMLLSLASASVLYFMLDIRVAHTDVAPVDWLLTLPAAGYLLTLLVVAGFTHSVNIVDGFHGLASGLVLLMLCGLLAQAWLVGDALVAQLCLLSLAATLGFFVWNWPFGKIFLGDCGAYLLGIWVVGLGLWLGIRNPSMAPMAPVLVGILPLVETLFSMYRRHFVRSHPVNMPDALHLHSLVYRRLLFNPARDLAPAQKNAANAAVAPYFWLQALLFGALSCVFMRSTLALMFLMLAFALQYIWLYQRLVRLRAPLWMVRRRTANPPPMRSRRNES